MTIPPSSSSQVRSSKPSTRTLTVAEQRHLVNTLNLKILAAEGSTNTESEQESIIGNCKTTYNLSLEEKKLWAQRLRHEASKFLSLSECDWKMGAFEHLMKQLEHHQHRIVHYLTSSKDYRLKIVGSLLTPVEKQIITFKADSLGNHYLAYILRAAYEKIKFLQEVAQQSASKHGKDEVLPSAKKKKKGEDFKPPLKSEEGQVVSDDDESEEEQQQGTSSSLPSRKRLSKDQKSILHEWLVHNWSHPYPSDEEKEALARKCNISVKRVNHWYINARVRIWRPVTNEAARKAASTGSTNAVADLLRNCKSDNVFKKYLTGSNTPSYDFLASMF